MKGTQTTTLSYGYQKSLILRENQLWDKQEILVRNYLEIEWGYFQSFKRSAFFSGRDSYLPKSAVSIKVMGVLWLAVSYVILKGHAEAQGLF